jgi:hypothetical protein
MFPYTRKWGQFAGWSALSEASRGDRSPLFVGSRFVILNLRPMNTLPKHRTALPDEQELRNRARAGLTEELPNIITEHNEGFKKSGRARGDFHP